MTARGALGLLVLLVGSGVMLAQEGEADFGDEPARDHGALVSIFSGNLHVPAGDRYRDGVVAIGANAAIDGEVRGDVVVIGGELDLSGRVHGDVVGVLSELRLRDGEISGQLVNVLGGMRRESTRVAGPIVNLNFGSWFPRFWALLFWIRVLGLLFVFVLLVLLSAVAADRIRVLADEAPVRYVTAFFVGLLGYIVFLSVFSLLALTVVGIPIAIFAWALFKWLAVAGVFYAIGRRVGRSLGRELSVLGSVLLMFALYAVALLAPAPLGLVGLVIVATFKLGFLLLVEIPAIGLLLLTRGGSRSRVGPERGSTVYVAH
jgi:hypothetical protein